MIQATPGTDLTVAKSTAVGAVIDYGEDAGAGFENQTKSDYLLPFLTLLQSNSPQVTKELIEGAKAGMFFNTATDAIYDGKKGVLFVAVHTEHKFVEWKPRSAGGGFVASYEPEDLIVVKAIEANLAAKGDFGKYKSAAGNDLVETFYVYGLLLDDEGFTQQCVIAFKSMAIKKYRAWMTKALSIQTKSADNRKVRPPLFAHVFRLVSFDDKNKTGQEFKNVQVSFNGAKAADCRLGVDDPIYIEARGFRDVVTSGQAKVDTGAEGKAQGEKKDEDIPF